MMGRIGVALLLGSVFASGLLSSSAGRAQVLGRQKISSLEGGFAGVLDDADNFGRSCVSPGDLDGDGVVDLSVGALLDDDGANDAGALWILFLNRSGTVRAHQKISALDGGFSGALDVRDAFGVSQTALGDVDNNGVPDLAVGAFLDDDGGTDRGAVWILLLEEDGVVKAESKISETEGGFGGALSDVDGLGRSVVCLGDLDGNGTPDLAAGAPGTDDGGANRGAVWILFLDAGLSVLSEQKISVLDGGFNGGLSDSDEFGVSLAELGDLDGDGNADLAVSAPGADDGGERRGAVWILFLNSDGTVKDHQKISPTDGCFLGALSDFDLFGVSLASVGDLDGDGTDDLAVGSRRDDDGGDDVGAVWLVFLNPDGTVKAFQKISATRGGFEGELGDGDEFSSSVSRLGDLDLDGREDLVVGAMRDDDGGVDSSADRGALWVLFLDAPCFRGTVDAGSGPIADVLFVNSRVGTVSLRPGAEVTVSHTSCPSGPLFGRYGLFVWIGTPRNSGPLIIGAQRLGCFVNPVPLQGGLPAPFLCLRGSLPPVICSGVSEVPAPATTPWTVTQASGLAQPMILTLQGLVEDDGAANSLGFSVTNAVVLKVEE